MKPEPDFGVKIPAQPQLMLDMEQARGLLHRRDASLVSIRSWPEFVGTTSGYSYIKPKVRLQVHVGDTQAATPAYGRFS